MIKASISLIVLLLSSASLATPLSFEKNIVLDGRELIFTGTQLEAVEGDYPQTDVVEIQQLRVFYSGQNELFLGYRDVDQRNHQAIDSICNLLTDGTHPFKAYDKELSGIGRTPIWLLSRPKMIAVFPDRTGCGNTKFRVIDYPQESYHIENLACATVPHPKYYQSGCIDFTLQDMINSGVLPPTYADSIMSLIDLWERDQELGQ